MMTAKELREKRFEKAAWGYRPEEIDEFLGELETTFKQIEQEREDSNHKIQVLADRVREYMRDEDALKDAMLGAQKEGHRVLAEANDKAAQILEKAKEEAAVLLDEATRQHEELMEKNRAEIQREQDALVHARQLVADFKRSLFDMYKDHLAQISAMPEPNEEEKSEEPKKSEPKSTPKPEPKPVPKVETPKKEKKEEPKPEEETLQEPKRDPFATSQFSTRVIQGAYESRFSDLQFGDNNNQQ